MCLTPTVIQALIDVKALSLSNNKYVYLIYRIMQITRMSSNFLSFL